MKVYGALELAQLEWFLDSAKPSAASFIYRVIYVSDLKQIQVSDGTNWIPFLNTSTNQTLSGDITFSGQQIFNGLHRLSVTTNSATGAIVALAPTTPITEFTGAVTSVSGITSGASGATVMLINRSGSPFTVLDEDTGATAGNRIRTGTGASITLTNNASILLSYAGDSRWHVVGGTGSSSSISGAKNYFVISSANSNFSQNSVSPWSACTLTFSGGIPSGAPTLTATQMAIAATATNPLLQSQSNYNLQLTKSAANAQYQGFISGELTIDREDLAKVLTGSFSYEVASGTVDFSGTSAQDLEIWVYNTVSGAWTQPAGFRGMNTSSGTGVVSFTFQTDSTAANNKYKIAVITQQTSATAYSVNFNDFSVGPTVVVNGTPVTDWVDRGLITLTAVTANPSKGTTSIDKVLMRRVGDSAQFLYNYAQTAAGASAGTGDYLFSLPAGMSIDTSKIQLVSGGFIRSGNTRIGSGTVSITTFGTTGNVDVYPYSATQVILYVSGAQDTTGAISSAVDEAVGSGVFPTTTVSSSYKFTFTVPIAGWSSNVQTSNDTDTRVVACRVTGTPTGTITSSSATTANINFPTVAFDTHASYSSGLYTVPVSGIYRVTSHARSTVVSGGTFQALGVFVDGSFVNNSTVATPTSSLGVQLNTLVSVSAGQTIAVRLWTDGTTPTFVSDAGAQFLNIERLSGPSVVAASETVVARYNIAAAVSISTTQPVNYATKVFDSHNAVTTGASWKFTAPISGTYQVSTALAMLTSTATIIVRKSGTNEVILGTATTTSYNGGTQLVKLNSGDYIDVVSDTASQNTNASTFQSISIERVGN
jgi:hypothetical protein